MRTLEEINEILFPTEKIDMTSVLKDVLQLKLKNGEMTTFRKTYVRSLGDIALYIDGIAIINGNVIVSVRTGDEDCDYEHIIGTLATNGYFKQGVGIGLNDALITDLCKFIFKDNEPYIGFDFSTLKSGNSPCFCGSGLEERIKKHKDLKKKIEGFINGTEKGYVEW
jgi:hypothetical protein